MIVLKAIQRRMSSIRGLTSRWVSISYISAPRKAPDPSINAFARKSPDTMCCERHGAIPRHPQTSTRGIPHGHVRYQVTRNAMSSGDRVSKRTVQLAWQPWHALERGVPEKPKVHVVHQVHAGESISRMSSAERMCL